ncbi:LLM class flavin-dependent oxidoreductase [Marinobacterium sp. D7]|uniref:LLM class flavin-dependent oxidoreductase n=1 Tax=Marinobacterium ramblicola TaxID=2849041 RepID=UPI001C2D5AF2|nr:LLM class flavin-dependent oxidoreductase [Marinobacterium ramblicola]MBV1790415.1 LLM class flavin-dependent oxidoreductase [Marinobacterium ramblicola]
MKSLSTIPFSVLELAPIRLNEAVGDTLARTIEYARHAEGCGIKRFWLAEHHNMQGIASSATSVLIGAVAVNTDKMRVGSGGIMLPNHPPLVIAEQFGTLDALYPGRIDLGLGRAPGTDPLTSRALRRDDMRAEHFPEEVAQLQKLLGPADPDARVRAIPGEGSQVKIWLLGSSLFSAQLAAERGLPYAFAGHFAPRHAYEALTLYRRQFRPSDVLDSPYAILGVPLIAAQSDDEARYLATSSQQRVLSLIRGEPLWLRPPVERMDGLWSPHEKASVEAFLGLQIVGGPATLRSKLEHLIEEFPVDELMFTNDLYDQVKRLEALSILTSLA